MDARLNRFSNVTIVASDDGEPTNTSSSDTRPDAPPKPSGEEPAYYFRVRECNARSRMLPFSNR